MVIKNNCTMIERCEYCFKKAIKMMNHEINRFEITIDALRYLTRNLVERLILIKVALD